MSKNIPLPTSAMPWLIVSSLSARLTVGGAVCFTEGVFATILLMIPKASLIGSAPLVALVIWLLFLRFRDSKLGAEIGDLCFIELLLHTTIFALDANGVDIREFWYGSATISMLKLIRVYASEKFATQQYGWGQFGFMTRRYAQRSPESATMPWRRLALEISAALVIAAIASFATKSLPDWARVGVAWGVPFWFEFLNGPRQLKMVAELIAALLASNNLVEELNQKVANQDQAIADLAAIHNVPPDVLAQFAKIYNGTHPVMRPHLLDYSSIVETQYPIPPSEK